MTIFKVRWFVILMLCQNNKVFLLIETQINLSE